MNKGPKMKKVNSKQKIFNKKFKDFKKIKNKIFLKLFPHVKKLKIHWFKRKLNLNKIFFKEKLNFKNYPTNYHKNKLTFIL